MIGKDSRPSENHIRRSREYVEFLVPALREIARRRGYALTMHGSFERDIDLVACPWTDQATAPDGLVADFFRACEIVCGFATWPGNWTEGKFDPPSGSLPNPERKPHGRLGYSILLPAGPYLDISVMPRVESKPEAT